MGDFNFREPSHRVCQMLYKYFSNTDYAKNVILNKEIHLETPSEYNDIFDSAFYITKDSLKNMHNTRNNICNLAIKTTAPKYHCLIEEFRKSGNNEITKFDDLINHILQKNSKINSEDFIEMMIEAISHNRPLQAYNNKISVFSEKCDSQLMWAYYANNYEGVCLGFDISLDKTIHDNCYKVQYSNEYVFSNDSFDFYFRKSEQWSHEQEWRIVCDTKSDYIKTNSLKSIIIGYRTPMNLFAEFLKLGKYNKLDVYKISTVKGKYQIQLQPLFIDGKDVED